MKTFLAVFFGAYFVMMSVFGVIVFAAEDHETLSPVPCKLHNHDVLKIANAVFQNVPKDLVLSTAQKYVGLEITRMEAIRKLIDDAYKNAGNIQQWYDNHLWICKET